MSFTVRLPNGGLLHFGHTADSRVVHHGSGVIEQWNINRAEDAAGNRIDYTYTLIEGRDPDGNPAAEHLPDRILYGGNETQGVAHHLEVRFIYEERPDKSHGWDGREGART